jgi:hypothetical protein
MTEASSLNNMNKRKKRQRGKKASFVFFWRSHRAEPCLSLADSHSLGQNISALAEEGPNTEPEGVGYGIAIREFVLRLRLYPLIRADSKITKAARRESSRALIFLVFWLKKEKPPIATSNGGHVAVDPFNILTL